jgi:hypothetical protein
MIENDANGVLFNIAAALIHNFSIQRFSISYMAIVWQYAHRASSIVTILFYSYCKKIVRLTRDRSFNPLILGKLLFLTLPNIVLPFNLQIDLQNQRYAGNSHTAQFHE